MKNAVAANYSLPSLVFNFPLVKKRKKRGRGARGCANPPSPPDFTKKLFNLQKSMQKLPKKEEALLQIPGVPGTEVPRSEGAPALAAAAAGGERGGGIRGGGGKEEAEGKKKA
jgi:hypothetical protein